MKNRVLISLLTLLLSVSAFAQNGERDYKSYPYGFVGLQGGVLRNYTGSGFDRNWDPMGAVQLGYMVEALGVRLQAYGSKWTTDLTNTTEFKNKVFGVDLDLMVNFSNIILPNRNNLLNVYGIVGIPIEAAIPHVNLDNYESSLSDDSKWKKGWKGGGMLELNLAKHWAVSAEGGVMAIEGDQWKWWPYAMAGITYKFGHKKVKNVAPAAVPVVAEVVEEAATEVAPAKPVVQEKKPEPAPAPKPQPAAKPQPAKTTQNIFFGLGKTTITAAEAQKIDAVAEWAKANPTANIQLTGYADSQTGNSTVNQAISERRSAAVKDALVKRGVAASRIQTDAKGDTVQPFSVNDQNRAVIIIGEAK